MEIKSRILVCITLLMLPAQAALSSGSRLPEASVEGVALSDALVANTELSGAFPYNYANMIFQNEGIVSVELIHASGNASITPLAPNTLVGKKENQGDDAILPALYYTQKINEKYSWGAHIGVPFGTEMVIPSDTYSYFNTVDTAVAGGGQIAGLHPTTSNLEMINITPSIGIKLNDQTAVSLALDYYMVDKVQLDSVGSAASGDGNTTGWAISLLHLYDKSSVGLSYHSAFDVDIDGSLTVIGLGTSTVSTTLNMPSRLQLGFNKELSDKISIELDLERIGWGSYKEIVITSTGGVIPAGTEISRTAENWKDITNVRLGLTVNYNSQIKLLFGAGTEAKVQKDEFLDPTVPDNDRKMVSAGMTYDMNNGWELKAGYQYAWGKDRTLSGRDYLNQIITSGATVTDPNGADVFNGKYKFSAQMLAFGATKTF